VSIVGCDEVAMGLARVKADQERVVETSPVPWTIVRAPQFHELVAATLTSAARLRVLPLPRVRLCTVAAAEAARAIAGLAEGPARNGRVEIGGPETADVRDLARTWRAATGRRVPVLPVRVPGRLGRALRGGALVADAPETRGTTSFAAWLARDQAG
jgi:uncharacterized protein YbjT (DUF2867 family)